MPSISDREFYVRLMILCMIFAVVFAKLMGAIEISWLWLTSPIWIPTLIVVVGFAVIMGGLVMTTVLGAIAARVLDRMVEDEEDVRFAPDPRSQPQTPTNGYRPGPQMIDRGSRAQGSDAETRNNT